MQKGLAETPWDWLMLTVVPLREAPASALSAIGLPAKYKNDGR